MQPAPIQVSYMGLPGTSGASYIDYLVTDEFVSPSRYSHIYSEKLVHLPHCYFVNDYKQINLDVSNHVCQHKRSDYGLPETSSYLHVSISFTRLTLKSSSPGAIYLSVSQIVHSGFLDSQLQARQDSGHVVKVSSNEYEPTDKDVLYEELPVPIKK